MAPVLGNAIFTFVVASFGNGVVADTNLSGIVSERKLGLPPRNKCPGKLDMPGIGKGIEIIPTGWEAGPEEDNLAGLGVVGEKYVKVEMGARAYFGHKCTGLYNNQDYIGADLMGKKIRFTIDVSKAGCGCNAAMYLTSMRQNPHPSDCKDFYCDANNVCGESCPEIDIMEANKFAFHATLHTTFDHGGLGGGYGGGDSWTGPRDFTAAEYGPGARCIDTNKPYVVEAAFPTSSEGYLEGMFVTLLQHGKNCPLHINIDTYSGIKELSQALAGGMVPIVSYWSSPTMLWMDGAGADHRGPCKTDSPANCGSNVHMWGFAIHPLEVVIPLVLEPGPSVGAPIAEAVPIGEKVAQEAEAPSAQPNAPEALKCAATRKGDCRFSMCCKDPGMQCYEKSEFWAACQVNCTPGIDPRDPIGHHTPWSCVELGKRTPGVPKPPSMEPQQEQTPSGQKECAATEVEDCTESECCKGAGMQCYQKHVWWSACLWECESSEDDVWSCNQKGPRTAGLPEVTTTKIIPAWEHELWIPERDTSEKVQEMFTTVTATYTTTTAPCSATRNQDCTLSKCCADPGMQCFQKDQYWASCQLDCEPGLDMRDPEERRTPWTCKMVGGRSPGQPLITTTTLEPAGILPEDEKLREEEDLDWSECSITREQDCSKLKCCQDPGMQCYEKNQYWAACELDCSTGEDPRDAGDMRTPWTCKTIGPRTPGVPMVTTTSTLPPTLPLSAAQRIREIIKNEERKELEAIFESMEQPAAGFPDQKVTTFLSQSLLDDYEANQQNGNQTSNDGSRLWLLEVLCVPVFAASLAALFVTTRRNNARWITGVFSRFPNYRRVERRSETNDPTMPLHLVRAGLEEQDRLE